MLKLPETAKRLESAFIVEITPQLALLWLKNNNFNRKLNPATAYRYCNQMLNGQWRLTHQGIAFDRNGLLIDGQHRLMAVCMSKKTVPMLVFTSAQAADHEAIDAGKVRTNLDVLQMETKNNQLKLDAVTTLKAMLAGRYCTRPNMGSIELDIHYMRFRKGIDFAVDQFEDLKVSRELNDPTVRGVIARAWHTAARDKLLLFCAMYRTGYEQNTLISNFRDWMLSLHDRRESTRREIYKRCELTLQAFLQGKDRIETPVPFAELYPLTSVSS